MDVREKLVEMSEQLRYCADVSDCANCKRWDKVCENKCVDNLLLMAADLIDEVANGVTVQEWKPISEPPKEKGTYLVCTDNGGVLLGHWYGTAWNAGGGANKHLAYWTEKPQPPKGE